MEDNQQFAKSLIARRNHYQSLCEKYERSRAHAREQIKSNANALLFESIVQEQELVENLIALRHQWQGLSQECERQIYHAKEQINHINALLTDVIVMQQLEQPVSIQASTVNDFPALNLAADIGVKESPQVDPASAVDELDEQDKADSLTQSVVVQPSESDRKLSSESGVSQRQHKSTLLPTNPLPVSPDSRQDSDASASSKQTIASLPLLTNPTPTAVVDNDLKESPTEVDSLSKADESEDASKLDHLDEVDDPELPLPAASQKSDSQTSPSKSVNASSSASRQFPVMKTPMLPSYAFLTKSQAVERLLREKEGTILHVDYIIRALYGELDADAIREEKPRIFDTLSKGTSKGLWHKVPDQSGCYTIDLASIDPDLAAKANQQRQKGRRRFQQSRGKR